jgi:hypothetical protein
LIRTKRVSLYSIKSSTLTNNYIYAEVVTRVAGSLEAGGLPGYPKVLYVEINVMKSCQSFVALYFTQLLKNTRS